MRIKLSRLPMPVYTSPSRLLAGSEQWRHLGVYYCFVGVLAVWLLHLMGTRLPYFYSSDELAHRMVMDYIRNTSYRLHRLKTWDTEKVLGEPDLNVTEPDPGDVPDLINEEGEENATLVKEKVLQDQPEEKAEVKLDVEAAVAEAEGKNLVTSKDNLGAVIDKQLSNFNRTQKFKRSTHIQKQKRKMT